ncbi:hypothetical protein Tco_0706296 [Tanacetum coccineum]|uniref:Uncharacterized protein n=1 Tax=Tanacetum coccineum TaxID=301880 RepID=A0ABQ4Y746_9ASTR
MPKYTIKSIDNASLKEYDQKSALYQTMHENKSFNRNPANHALYHALMEALIEDENAIDKRVADTVKDRKIKHDDDDKDPSARPNQGKKIKRRRTKESESFKKPCTTKDVLLIMRFLALGWHLEEIHVTWAHLEKKRTRLRLYTKNHEELFTQSLETASQP